MSDSHPHSNGLPELPALEELVARARTRCEHFVTVRDAAQKEIDDAEAYLSLVGEAPRPRRRSRGAKSANRRVTDGAMMSVLTAVGSHRGYNVETISRDAGYSTAHVHFVTRHAERSGLVVRDRRRNGKLRFLLTEAGEELVTSARKREDEQQ